MNHPLIERLHFQWLATANPLILGIDLDVFLLELSGDPSLYGFVDIALGQDIAEHLLFLDGLLDESSDEVVELPFITLENDCVVNVTIYPHENGWDILFLSAEKARQRIQKDQQSVHDLQLLQRELTQMNQALSEKNHQLIEAGLAKGRFIANMSHEFRTPLTSVLGYSELIQQSSELPDQVAGQLGEIDRASNHLLVMIDNLLDQARIDAGQLDMLLVRVDLLEVIHSVVGMIKPLAVRKGLAFKETLSDQLPAFIETDGMRLKQILINILGNAVKYTQQGQIHFHVDFVGTCLVFKVVDTGLGIDESQHEKIFQPFEQNGVMAKGAGLGLGISQHFCRLMKGSIQLDSEVGKGSEFTVSLPMKVLPPLDNVTVDRVLPVITAHLSDKRILLVEDDEDIQLLMSIHLSSLCDNVKICSNGQEALDQYQTFSPDLVLMDMHMPVLDGISTVKIMRKRGYVKPIIALTASISGSSKSRVMDEGCTDFLQKPIDREKMLAALSSYLMN